jgi:hypothetical protein
VTIKLIEKEHEKYKLIDKNVAVSIKMYDNYGKQNEGV